MMEREEVLMADDVEPDQARQALADMRDQQDFVAQRFAKLRRLHLVIGLAMGVAAGTLAVENKVVLVVAVIVYMIGVVYTLGTPTWIGVVPRDDARSAAQVGLGAFALLGVLSLAAIGASLRFWWLCVAAGAISVAAVIVVGRWRLTAIRRRIVDGAGDAR
jgi:hypothetical protein